MENQPFVSATASRQSSGDRWELLKPVIEQLYMSEGKKLSELVATMKRDHGFDAGENQYKYHFTKWKWKRSLSKKKKAAVAAELQTRALIGRGSTSVTRKGRPVDAKQIRRHIKESMRQSKGMQLTFTNGIFLKWNMPYASMQDFLSRSLNRGPTSPFSVPTPASDISYASPPVSAPSPSDAPSPTTAVVKMQTAVNRARLFFEGHHDQLISSMNKKERIIMSEWLYQYWYYGFKTAKTWGRGPRNWTATSLRFDDFSILARNSSPSTSGAAATSPSIWPEEIARPSDLCRWVIHVPYSEEHFDNGYVSDEEALPGLLDSTPDPNDESTWSEWPAAWQGPPLNTRLRDALEHGDFSTIQVKNLPVAVPQIAAAAQRSNSELLGESLGFAIMSRNLDLTEATLDRIAKANVDVTSLYPLHLAVAYLDGSKSCCDIFRKLMRRYYTKDFFVDESGHTVLDSLMITILKSHTSIKPHELDHSLRNLTRFPGEEVDICGRWDADSDCIRQLYASGISSVPFEWKHRFCHTSVQAICHCIISFNEFARLDLPSGLYQRQCFSCGLKLQLQPLHTLVVTAFRLASSACEGEDLFGMIACLLCFIACRLDPHTTAPISVSSLFSNVDLEDQCDHEMMSPQELCRRLSEISEEDSWSHPVQTGWKLFCIILTICMDTATTEDDALDEDDLFCDVHEVFTFGNRQDIASLWAAVQAEILTYRRLDEGSDWLSRYFDMEGLLKNLGRGQPASTRLMDEGLLKKHCRCGWLDREVGFISTVEAATTEYIANLDVWQRATYLVLPDPEKYW